MPRKQERVAVSIEVILEWKSGKRDVRISDLSLSGCFVDTIAHVGKSETVTLELKISQNESLLLTGEVVYDLPNFGFGVRFSDLSDEQRSKLERIILAHGGNPASRGDIVD